MLAVAKNNMDLTKYLVSEVMQSMEQRLDSLRRFYPEAKAEDWRLEVAGQRVQIIKKDPKKGGVLQFGTELVAAKDGSLAALLGASPGASVTVSIMLELIEKCFPNKASGEWAAKLAEIFPAREKVLETDAALYRKINAHNNVALELVEASNETESYA
jgi:malate dehydrogenase (quinone)